jgi:hypothetical protein
MGSSSALNRGFDDTLTKAPEKGIPVVAIDTGIDNAWLRTMSQLGQTRRFRDVRGMSGLPQQQTSPDTVGTSHLCQERK